MSHLTKVKSQITDLTLLKQTLDDLEIQYLEAAQGETLEIRGWNKEKTNAQLVLKTGGPYDVGVVVNEVDKTFEFVADWWGVETYTEMTEKQYVNKISQKYAYNNVMEKVRSKGYSVVEEKNDQKQNIHVVLRKWS